MDARIPNGIVKHRAASFEQDQPHTIKYLDNDKKQDVQEDPKQNGFCSAIPTSHTYSYPPSFPFLKLPSPTTALYPAAPNPTPNLQTIALSSLKLKAARLATQTQRLARDNVDLVDMLDKYREINTEIVKQNAALLKMNAGLLKGKRKVLEEKMGLEGRVLELEGRIAECEGGRGVEEEMEERELEREMVLVRKEIEIEKRKEGEKKEVGEGDEKGDEKSAGKEEEKKKKEKGGEKSVGKEEEMGKREQEEDLGLDVFMMFVLELPFMLKRLADECKGPEGNYSVAQPETTQ
ncbi:hypothetical protein FB567DRAFT_586639 [Paraphoma chrysanthemicola]|uniref:Uncharacterized protein n=1 Tax=Paraphoma chrysanthemicola TaxID=798071 RepID=A0A8K0RK70_9PLEO|nr:hypothetical protein FB567DRAFT_586639 [Paraphoma chrysanthemicola]